MPTPRTHRLIGYSTFYRVHADLSRTEFLRLAHAGTFGEIKRVGRRVMVPEAGVRLWLRGGCRTMADVVRSKFPDETRPDAVEGTATASQGKARPAANCNTHECGKLIAPVAGVATGQAPAATASKLMPDSPGCGGIELRGGPPVGRLAHNQEIPGAIPGPAMICQPPEGRNDKET